MAACHLDAGSGDPAHNAGGVGRVPPRGGPVVGWTCGEPPGRRVGGPGLHTGGV